MSKISDLNDALRKNPLTPGKNKVFITTGVSVLPPMDKMLILKKIINFNDFNEGNDPYGEHDFGCIEHHGLNYFFKIDYYDNSMTCGSDDASNPDITIRVLTIMRADEH